MWRALKSGYGHFPRGREGYRTIWRKKKFFGKFFPKGDHCSFWHFSLDSTDDQIFFPKSFFYTLVMWRALESGYGYFPRGREGYRTIWRKKKFFGKFFPKWDHCSFWHFPLDSTEIKFFFQSLSFIP